MRTRKWQSEVSLSYLFQNQWHRAPLMYLGMWHKFDSHEVLELLDSYEPSGSHRLKCLSFLLSSLQIYASSLQYFKHQCCDWNVDAVKNQSHWMQRFVLGIQCLGEDWEGCQGETVGMLRTKVVYYTKKVNNTIGTMKIQLNIEHQKCPE